MKTLTAQRLQKKAAKELQSREEMLSHLFEEARAEAAKLSTLLTYPAEKTPRQTFEEYREDNEDSYFEQGIIER
jgi:hypothetical protein